MRQTAFHEFILSIADFEQYIRHEEKPAVCRLRRKNTYIRHLDGLQAFFASFSIVEFRLLSDDMQELLFFAAKSLEGFTPFAYSFFEISHTVGYEQPVPAVDYDAVVVCPAPFACAGSGDSRPCLSADECYEFVDSGNCRFFHMFKYL